MNHTFTFFKIFILFNSISLYLDAQNYGHAYYQHSLGGAVLCDAFTTQKHQNVPGYMMASFKSWSPATSYNFTLDRTSLGGSFSNSGFDFKKAYVIHADPTEECDVTTRPVDNCVGVSIIETSPPPSPGSQQAYYAMAGAYDKACFFTLVDAQGNCFNSSAYQFPGRDFTNITKPLIIECSAVSGHYIICGSFDRTMYVIRVNSQGQIIWSSLYPIQGEPRDMIEAAFGPNKHNEFIVVGKSYFDYANNLTDAFVMKLDQNTGVVYMARRVNLWSFPLQGWGNQHFNHISVIQKETPNASVNHFGYVLAGYTDQYNINTIGRGLYHRLDSNLNFSAIEIFGTIGDPTGGEIVDIVGRQTVGSTTWYYYSLIKNSAGMSVIRTNFAASGNFSSPMFVNIFKEFDYYVPGHVTRPCAIGMYNVTNSPFSGLQLFGDYTTTNGQTLHLVKSYFNGLEGCYSSTSTPLASTPGSSYPVDNFTPYGSLSACTNFFITDVEDGSYNNICGPLDSVSNGSNQRYAQTVLNTTEANELIRIYPNPSRGLLNLDYYMQEPGTINISILNLLGQEVANLTETRSETGNFQIQVDLDQLGVKPGIYVLNYNSAFEQVSRRVVVENH